MTCHSTTYARSTWIGYNAGKGARQEGTRTDEGRGTVEKELMNGRVAEGTTEAREVARKLPRAANLTGTVTRTTEALTTKGERRKATGTWHMAHGTWHMAHGKSEVRHLQTGENEGSESLLILASQLFDGSVSERGRQVQANRNRKSTT